MEQEQEQEQIRCENCEKEILTEYERYEIQPDLDWCEECMEIYLNGPVDPDEIDNLAEQLKMI
jgi:hypothetical protein